MLKANFSASSVQLNRDFSSTFRDELRIQIRQGARAYVREAVKHIPIDTGQARGTFLPLGRFLHVSVPLAGAKPQRIKNASTGANEHPLIFSFESGFGKESFTLDPELFYYILNDFNSRAYPHSKNPTPWRSMIHGAEAFDLYMKTEGLRKLPRLGTLLNVSNTTYGANRGR